MRNAFLMVYPKRRAEVISCIQDKVIEVLLEHALKFLVTLITTTKKKRLRFLK